MVVGKTTMPEFGAFPYTESASRGITRNPWDRTRTPGGSSGGTAARSPPAWCRSAWAVTAAARSGSRARAAGCSGSSRSAAGSPPPRTPHLWFALGTAGPLTRSVLDSALVYDVIRGNVPGDLYTAGETGSFVDAARREPGRLRIGWSTKPVTPRRAARPDPRRARSRTRPGC